MSEIKCIIVEDEPLAAKVLKDYIAQVPFLKLQGTFKDAILATEWLQDNATELIFLDIHLPKLKGMAFLRTLVHPPSVIITTAYHQYAIEGFNQNVTDYLLKPIDFERFLVAVNKVKSIHSGKSGITASGDKEYLFVNSQRKKIKILFSEILYIESQREYIRIVSTRKEFYSKMSTYEIEKMLPEQQFKRVHRSFLAAINKVDSYTADSIEINGVPIPVGRGYRDIIEKL